MLYVQWKPCVRTLTWLALLRAANGVQLALGSAALSSVSSALRSFFHSAMDMNFSGLSFSGLRTEQNILFSGLSLPPIAVSYLGSTCWRLWVSWLRGGWGHRVGVRGLPNAETGRLYHPPPPHASKHLCKISVELGCAKQVQSNICSCGSCLPCHSF